MKDIVESEGIRTGYPSNEGGGWFQGILRVFGGARGRSRLDDSAHFADLMHGRDEEAMSIADIPVTLRRRLQEDAIRKAFYRLEMPLRFLLHATTPGREPKSVEECNDILSLWRQALEQEILLQPDAYTGAIRSYEPTMERDYTIHGRCQPGAPLRVVIPCWRLQGEVVVRGEAEPMESGAATSRASSQEWGREGMDVLPALDR
jgi:hypothetical protein